MRRLNVRLLLVFFAVITALLPLAWPSSARHADAPTLTPVAYLPLVMRPYENLSCQVHPGQVEVCAGVSNSRPSRNSTVTVYGRLLSVGSPVAGAPMHTVWHYRTTTQTEDCLTGSDGIGLCSREIGSATPGYTVQVDVTITYQDRDYGASTAFTPS